ncbi:MAG: helix-turn-helix transcriptional regulator, partial [Nitrospinae bacterium]|nr:helix-turn-helix transcriptional regulator [Nitrospinota bacterium]
KELAKRLRVSQSRISQIEDPDHRPSVRVYERAAKALGCEIEDLI